MSEIYPYFTALRHTVPQGYVHICCVYLKTSAEKYSQRLLKSQNKWVDEEKAACTVYNPVEEPWLTREVDFCVIFPYYVYFLILGDSCLYNELSKCWYAGKTPGFSSLRMLFILRN